MFAFIYFGHLSHIRDGFWPFDKLVFGIEKPMNIIMYASRPKESYNFKYAIIYGELKLFLVRLYNNNKDEHGNLVM